MPEWIEAAVQEIYECMFGNVDRKLAAEIVLRHYDAASRCRWCSGKGEIYYAPFGMIRKLCPTCNGTGKVMPDEHA